VHERKNIFSFLSPVRARLFIHSKKRVTTRFCAFSTLIYPQDFHTSFTSKSPLKH
jgi:hypothetical protein